MSGILVDFLAGRAIGPLCGRGPDGKDVVLRQRVEVPFKQDGYGIRGKLTYKGKKYAVIDAQATIDDKVIGCLWLCEPGKEEKDR